MSDTIGRIIVPTPTNSGQTFPLVSDMGYSTSRAFPTITHRFGELATKANQTFAVGIGPRKFHFQKSRISLADRKRLTDFYEAMQGSYQSFTYNAPQSDKSTVAYQVIFETQPLSVQDLVNGCQSGIVFVECGDADSTPSYTIASTCTRFPSTALQTGLLSDVQQIIPLVHIKVREAGVSDIYLSDRRVKVGDNTYLPRLLNVGEPGSDVLISQNINGQADNVQFQFGNADRVMTQLSNDTDLKYAEIDICLYHVNTGILLQLWKGVVQSYACDESAVFQMACSDGFFQIMNQYPKRQVSRQCWKTFNDGVNCPYASQGSGGDPTTCDYYLESPNGCQAHGMSKWFGGHQADPQGVNIKDNSTGFIGFGRNNVTATSIVSDTIWGLSLPEIYCNSGGDPTRAFVHNCLMVDYRDESDYADSLGIIGAGPIGGFTQPTVAQNADGYRYIVAPMVDGFTSQGFSVDMGNMTVQKNQNGMGLRQVQGNDPVNPTSDYFSLGQGTPQVWQPNNYAAGTALCEIRIQKPSQIQPSTPDQHQMTVPIDYGLSGWVWNSSGTRSSVAGLTNPYWIAVNMLLRAAGVQGPIPTPLQQSSIAVELPPSSAFSYAGSHIGMYVAFAVAGWVLSPALYVYALVNLIGQAFSGNAYSVPMSNAANQAEAILRQNVSNWSNLPQWEQTSANKATFTANFDTIWNAYKTACNTIAGHNPTGDAEKALVRSIADRDHGGKFDWYVAYRNPIANSATPGDSLTFQDLSAEQLNMFVLESLVNNESWTDAQGNTHTGSGAAQIADLQVPEILGTGNETQFQFQGVINSQKPFRDWLTEVLNCCLGYYTFEFGKLRLGCRINASATDAFTVGNMLFQSLKLTPIQAAFEHLVISYADVNYQFQANTAEYCDKTHAAYYGRAGAPLTGQMHSVGISTLNQALRIATTRVREEIGGINETEWKNARVATFGTTILGLNTSVGQVISITHPDIPGGSGDFRIKSWKLMKDYSIQIEAQTVTPSMYNLDVGPTPADVVPSPLPALFYPMPQGQWAPYQVQAGSSDAAFPNEYSFDIAQSSTTLADGTVAANVVATGKLPANQFIPNCGPVGIAAGNVTQSSTGGSIPGGLTLRVAVCAQNAAGVCSPPSSVILVQTAPGTNTNSFTVNGITWPSVSGLAGYVVFVSDRDDLICAQQTGSGQPSSITVTGPLERSTWALPNPDITAVRIKAKRLLHGGVLGLGVTSVSGNTIISTDAIDSSGQDNWTGRYLMVAGRNQMTTPFVSFKVTAFNPATGAFTVDRSATSGSPATSVEIGDVIIVCFKGYYNGDTPTTFTDAGISNSQNFDPVTKQSTPHSGLTAGYEKGNIIRVIGGTNRGAMAKILDNTATSYTLDQPLVIDSTSIVVVESPNWEYQGDATVNNADPQLSTNLTIPISNFFMTSLLLGGFTVTSDGVESPDGDIPVRITYVFGSGGTRTITSNDTQKTTDGRVYCDSTSGDITFQLLNDAQVYGQPLLIEKISTDAHNVNIACDTDDKFSNGNSQITLVNQGDSVLLKF